MININENFNTSNVTILHVDAGKTSILKENFNTSNVTILHRWNFKGDSLFLFQYIKCYYSTVMDKFEMWNSWGFQYIKCYYSTIMLSSGLLVLCYFNTSNVTILLTLMSITWRLQTNFNTSNVTILQPRRIWNMAMILEFQYIKCYYSTRAGRFH